jgi:hypothetical protein
VRGLPQARSGQTLRSFFEILLREDVDVRIRYDRLPGGEVVTYALVLLVRENGAWYRVRGYDNAHGINEMHRYNRDGSRQVPGEEFSTARPEDALFEAIDRVTEGFEGIIQSWRER